MEEITLRTNIIILLNANHSIVNIHDGEIGGIRRLVLRPVRLGRVRKRNGIGVEIDGKGQEPVFHDVAEGLVVDRRGVGREEERKGRAVQLGAGVEDQFPGRETPVRGRGCHVVGWAVDDEVAEDLLALEEGAVEGAGWVQVVEAVEEGLFCKGEEGF